MAKKFYKEQRNHSTFFQNAAERVVSWNAIAMNESPSNYEKFAEKFTHEKFVHQISLVEEELKEYRDAFQAQDQVEMLDAAADIFVVSGFLTYMFFGPAILNEFMNYGVADHLASDPYETLCRSREVLDSSDQTAFLMAAIFRSSRDSLVKTVHDGKGAILEVLRSNDSKFPNEEQLRHSHQLLTEDISDVLEAELAWIKENRTEYSDFSVVYNEEFQVYTFLDGNGKYMKPSTFSPANLKPFMVE